MLQLFLIQTYRYHSPIIFIQDLLNLTARPVVALVFLPALDQVYRAIIYQLAFPTPFSFL